MQVGAFLAMVVSVDDLRVTFVGLGVDEFPCGLLRHDCQGAEHAA